MHYLIKNLLSSGCVEHLVINQQFNILDMSPRASDFADVSLKLELGQDIRSGFPELIGLEDIFDSILNQEKNLFELRGIQRSHNSSAALFFDIYITHSFHKSEYLTVLMEEDKNKNPAEELKLLYLTIIIVNASERMALEQSLTQKVNEANFLLRNLTASKQYIDTVIASMPDALLVTTPSGKIKTINPAAEALLEYEQVELVGHSIYSIIEAANSFLTQNTSTLESNNSYTAISLVEDTFLIKDMETTCRTKSGKIVTIAFSCSIVQTGIENFQGYIYILRDMTERKQAELAKQEFLATITHEIRTPIASVIGIADLLLNTNLSFEQRQFTKTIHQSGNFLLEIINDILDFSKIESGKLEIEKEPFDLQTCIDEALYMIAPKAIEKGLQVLCRNTNESSPTVLGDITRLRQVLINLLGNAVKFTETGSVEISVITSSVESDLDGNKIYEFQFAVKDTGIGIPSDRLDRLFKAFTQVNSSITRQYGGTGLGLAISKQLTELMGGRIWVESEVGVGSTFYFTITASLVEQEVEIITHHKWETDIERQRADQYPLRILIVEDHIINQNVIRLMLQLMNYQPDVVSNGLEALAALRRQQYDLVLMDVQMPKMDGLTAAQYISREWTSDTRPRIVALTASSTLGERERCLASGMDDYLTKPINIKQLVQVLKVCQLVKVDEEIKQTISPIDPTALREIEAMADLNSGVNSQKFLVETIDCYLEEATKLLEDIQAAHSQGNIKTLQRAAHTLCSISATLGATTLAGLCAELEVMAATVVLTGATAQILKIEAEHEQVQVCLQQERSKYC